MYRRLITGACVVGLSVLIINGLANRFYWYTAIVGFDKFVHTLGGLFVALVAGAVFLGQTKHLKSHEVFVTLALCVFAVGLAWEYYEYILQAYFKTVHLADIPDSIGDLVFDMVGGSIGAYFVILMKKRYNTQ